MADNILWAGRFEDRPEKKAFEFQASINIDKELVFADIEGSRAHAAMLGKQGIISSETAAALEAELEKIASEISSGALSIDLSCEDIHSFIESVLTERLGDIGRTVHAGRSRNDQVAVDERIYLKKRSAQITAALEKTIQSLLDIADKNLETVMPGYTHLQRAQPITLAHHICAWVCSLRRDSERFADAVKRINFCPLGSGALAGSTLPLDRAVVSGALGFASPTINSMDSVSDRDYAVEFAFCCAQTQVHLSRFCEDIILWSSEEFKFIELSDAWSTGSSIMPQKKNPDFAELIRGKSARTIGNVVTLLTMLKGLPYAYNKDLQEDKEALFDSLDTVQNCLEMFTGMLESAKFNTQQMKASCIGGFLEATDAAEYLVRKGMPFRKAHEASAAIVRDCIAADQKQIKDRTLAELKQRSPLFENDIFDFLDPAASVASRTLSGAPAPQEVRKQIKALRVC
ncbi:MAG: argininosuccinate lyase [Termitinemataceae bacterium]|nr:MAG: argininosuccinate lyase [Termitinemataceae bacterium]